MTSAALGHALRPRRWARLAAALQALECEKLLAGQHDHLLAGRDLMVDARHSRHYVTRFGHNPECRMPDHTSWEIAAVRRRSRVHDL